MSKKSLPTVTIPTSDRQRLEKLTREAMERGDTDALFLIAAINRAVADLRGMQMPSMTTRDQEPRN